MIIPPRHGTASAHESAAAIGLAPTEREFTATFLVITDALLGKPSTADYVGRTRDAERWSVLLCGRHVDVIYHPSRALISLVLPSRRPGDAAAIPVVMPNGPKLRTFETVT